MRPKIKNLFTDVTLGFLSKVVFENLYFERSHYRNKKESVLLIQGYLTSKHSLNVLKIFFKKRNVNVYTFKDCLKDQSVLARNINLGWCDTNCALIEKKALEIKEKTGEAPYVVGWSLGGIYALNVFKKNPESFKKVITLGSPLTQSFSKNTSIKWLYDIVARNTKYLDKIISENSGIRDMNSVITIGAEKDGLVDYKICISPYTKSYVVDCYHMDIVSHPKTLKIIDQELFDAKNNIT